MLSSQAGHAAIVCFYPSVYTGRIYIQSKFLGNCSLPCWASFQRSLFFFFFDNVLYLRCISNRPNLNSHFPLPLDIPSVSPSHPRVLTFCLQSTESDECFLPESCRLHPCKHCAGPYNCSDFVSGRAMSHPKTPLYSALVHLPVFIVFLLLFCEVPWALSGVGIGVPFRVEHSAVTYCQHFDQL